MAQVWLYKKGQEPKIFDSELVTQATADGWVDTPAKFKRELEDLSLEELQALCTQKEITFVHNSKKETLIKKLRGE